MYFVVSVNARTSSGKIVGHAADLESAIAAVNKCAREYVLAKSEPLLHRREDIDTSVAALVSSVHFYSKDSASNIHQIDVFKQRTDSIKGWLGTTQQSQTPELIRRFMYCVYQSGQQQSADIQPAIEIPIAPTPPPLLIAKPKRVAPKTLPTGGFPANIIDSLIESEQFRQHRKRTDDNDTFRSRGLRINTSEDESDMD
jgi:hypothetical protein